MNDPKDFQHETYESWQFFEKAKRIKMLRSDLYLGIICSMNVPWLAYRYAEKIYRSPHELLKRVFVDNKAGDFAGQYSIWILNAPDDDLRTTVCDHSPSVLYREEEVKAYWAFEYAIAVDRQFHEETYAAVVKGGNKKYIEAYENSFCGNKTRPASIIYRV